MIEDLLQRFKIPKNTGFETYFAFFNHTSLLGQLSYSGDFSKEIFYYIPGMMSQACGLINRVIRLAALLFIQIGTLALCLFHLGNNQKQNKLVKNIFYLSIDHLLMIIINAVGVIAPPLAYRMNDYITEYFIKRLFPDLLNPFRDETLEFSNDDDADSLDLIFAYQTLKVSFDTPMPKISEKYRELCKKFHPDKNPNGEAEFLKTTKAYLIIKKSKENESSEAQTTEPNLNDID